MATQKKASATASANATQGASKPATPRKPAAQRKAPAKKAAPRKTAAKPPQTADSKVAPPPLTVYMVDPGAPYGCYRSDDMKGAYTQAMLELNKLVTRTKEGRVTPVKASPDDIARRVAVWGKAVEDTAFRHWRKTRGLIDMHGVTALGLNEAQARLEGRSKAFKTSAEMVDRMLGYLLKGGEWTHKGHTYAFKFKRELKV